jgi:UDP-N-acetylmuramoyl-tripeptide--D-alanyl-D-alanine ligase
VEMGTSSPGEIALLADICRPDVRVVINVGPAHLLELGGLEGVAREKGALVRSARVGDLAILNADDPWVIAMNAPCRTVSYGRSSNADIRLTKCEIVVSTMATRSEWMTPVGAVQCTIPAPGEHLAHNAGAALAVAYGLGLDLPTAAQAMASYQPVGMRLKVERVGGVVLFNDTYNANPASMSASLRVLAKMPGRRVAVLGDMLELGPGEGAWHEQIINEAVAAGLELVVAAGPRMSAAAVGIVDDKWRFEATDSVAGALASWVRPGDHLLFKGSRGARVERVLHGLQEALTGSGETS